MNQQIKRFLFIVCCMLFLSRKQLLSRYRSHLLRILLLKTNDSMKPIEDAVKLNFLEGREKGAQITLTKNGEIIFDCKAGSNENNISHGLTMIFSCTKVIESLVVAMLVDQKKLEYSQPIAKYWPRFGQVFSDKITIADLMGHRAGLEQIYQSVTTDEAIRIFSNLPELEEWVFKAIKIDEDVKRGEVKTSRYHAITRGIFVEILVQKVDGRTGRTFIQEEIVRPLEKKHSKKIDFYLGCPDSEQSRMEVCIPSRSILLTGVELALHQFGIVKNFLHPGMNATQKELDLHYHDFLKQNEVEMTLALLKIDSMARRTLILANDQGFGVHFLANCKRFRSLPLLSVTGCANSESLSLITAELACGGGVLISPQGLAEALQNNGPIYDELIKENLTYTNCGWSNDRLGPDWIGWAGAGGSYV